MSTSTTVSTVTDIDAALVASTESYEAIRNDNDLPETFHEAARALEPLKSAFEALKAQENFQGSSNNSRDSQPHDRALRKANRYQAILEEVRQAPNNGKFLRYKSVVGSNRDDLAEALVLAIIDSYLELANYHDSALESHAKGVRDVAVKLGSMEPSIPTTAQGNTFSHFGSGNQFNTTGGVQHNNTGSGQQFNGSIHGGIHYGNNPQSG